MKRPNKETKRGRERKRLHLHEDLPRGRHESFVGVPPHSHFELPENVVATESLRFNADGNPEAKRFLGVIGGECVPGPRLRDGRTTRYVVGGAPIGIGDDRHLITMAGSRAGKGRQIIVPNIILAPRDASMLVIDPKGQNASISARWRADGIGQKTGVLDPFGVSGCRTEPFRCVYNALDLLTRSDRRSFVPNAKLIADSLIVSGDFKDRHWDETAKQVLAGICALVATHERYAGNRNLVTVWHLISELAAPDPNDPHRYWLEKQMLASDAAGGMIRNAARGFYDRTGGEFSSVLSNLRKHTDWIGIECMADCLAGDSIDLRDLKRDSMALYVCLPAMRMSELSGWLRLVVQMTLAAHEDEPDQHGPNTLAILDEFNVLGSLSSIEVAAGQIAGLGLNLWAIIQDLQQLQSKYPKSWETFIANAGVLQAFGIADSASAEYLVKKLGLAPTLTRSTNSPSFDQASQQAATGENWSLGTHPLMDAEEVCRFFGRDDHLQRQLILRPGMRPMICQRVCYDQHELFRGKFDEESR
ncbi:type IV secretory system conjugative DNA transfer family protein [Crateriforma conspicua]|uniref:type IV secretory system conjugative DNA transfer family protein n=1 Tax=Crateriforma conspicua TaxID=2527996 RepID=UPI001189B0DA|nr:type IV secretory system conjugative DNA transfer family protein [Crateriforma conspicua]QDV61991.1 Conjugal transfer protein TraG [Crateriforma conspicua]